MAEPEPEVAQLVVDARHFAEEAAEDHESQGREQDDDAGALPLRFRATHERREKESPCHPGSGDPENGGLEMPGAREVVGKDAGQVETVKRPRLHAVMGDDATKKRLGQEENGHHQEVETKNLLARRQFPILKVAFMGMGLLLRTPSQKFKFSEHGENEPEAAEQHHEAHGAPEVGGGRGHISGLRIVGPVVGVGVIGAGTQRRGSPGGPGEIGVEIFQFRLVLYESLGQARGRRGAIKIGLPLALLGQVRSGLHAREVQRARAAVIPVLLELALYGFAHFKGLTFLQLLEGFSKLGLSQRVLANFHRAVEVFGGVVRAQVSAMSPEGAVLHEGVFQEHILTMLDVVTREESLAGGIHHGLWDGRRALIGLHGHQAQQGEAEEHDHQDGSAPPGRKRSLIVNGWVHGHGNPRGLGYSPNLTLGHDFRAILDQGQESLK